MRNLFRWFGTKELVIYTGIRKDHGIYAPKRFEALMESMRGTSPQGAVMLMIDILTCNLKE